MQKIVASGVYYEYLNEWLSDKKKVLLVCGNSTGRIEAVRKWMEDNERILVRFSDYKPNPTYESVVAGVEIFRQNQCDSIIAIGGGSAIDVAKCIKLYSNMDSNGEDGCWLREKPVPNDVDFLVAPTTAGTGSEATRFAVIYYNGVKQSVTDNSLIPQTVILNPELLNSLPVYQRKASMCDALCHAIESWWSVNSTDESREYSKQAVAGVMKYAEGYLNNTEEGNVGMLMAANTAGKAINITQTTAGHAMCYKITGLFGHAHGHAAVLCNRKLYPWMIEHKDQCRDTRGVKYFDDILNEIGIALGGHDAATGAERLEAFFESLELDVPKASIEQFSILKQSVNVDRLKNNPVGLDESSIDCLYHRILNGEER